MVANGSDPSVIDFRMKHTCIYDREGQYDAKIKMMVSDVMAGRRSMLMPVTSLTNSSSTFIYLNKRQTEELYFRIYGAKLLS